MRRRDLMKAALATGAVARADVPAHRWDGYDFGSGPSAPDRLNQGPFDVDQDDGWFTIATTSTTDRWIRNPGLGLVGYAWEEEGPALRVRKGAEPLERAVERLAALPFVDILYIRCDWRDIQTRPGTLDFGPVWQATMDAARKHGLRFAFRIQMSSPDIQPARVSMPAYLQDRVPLVNIGRKHADFDYLEPRYDSPAFQEAFTDLIRMLSDHFDGDSTLEWVDLMQYGFWGEGHTSDLKSPFPDYRTAEQTFTRMTRLQLDSWKKTPLAVNTQPDISNVGNREVIDMCVRAGCWLRSDSTIVEEPIQIEMLSNRPPWLAAILEDGYYRQYDITKLNKDAAGVNVLENTMLHALDLNANYWSLWTEAENLAKYNETYPEGFRRLKARIGYRVRPAWIWQRKRYGTSELILGLANDGVAGVPGTLRIIVDDLEGRLHVTGSLDAGHPNAGRTRQAAFLLPPGFDGKTVRIRAEIELRPGVRRGVRWACAQPTESDGSLIVKLKKHSDPDWRKNV